MVIRSSFWARLIVAVVVQMVPVDASQDVESPDVWDLGDEDLDEPPELADGRCVAVSPIVVAELLQNVAEGQLDVVGLGLSVAVHRSSVVDRHVVETALVHLVENSTGEEASDDQLQMLPPTIHRQCECSFE